MSNIIVLGTGMVGSAMAIDLADNHAITVIDSSKSALTIMKHKCPRITGINLDVNNKADLTKVIQPFDLVISAVPGFLGFNTLKAVIEAGKNIVDISFFVENALKLDALAKEKNVTALVDCGIAPGMDNILLGHYNEKMTVTDFECLVGGLPKVRKWPFFYKSPFSPVDVLEEYVRPARYVEQGVVVVREPLTDCEFVEFEKVGTLESFNSDGLRSLIHTMPHIPNMKEKTLRFPGHVEYIRGLKESGFFNHEKLEIDSKEVSPFDVTSQILINEWKLEEHEEEFTVMRVQITGKNADGQMENIIYDLYDEYCKDSKTSSMARTTGYTATAAANLVLDGLFEEKGVIPPELIGRHENCFNYFMEYLRKRDVIFEKSSYLIEAPLH